MYTTNTQHPPPPPSYIEATGPAFSQNYNTQYSTPLPRPGNYQTSPQPFGQTPVYQPGIIQPVQQYGQPNINQPGLNPIQVGPRGPHGHPIPARTQQMMSGMPRVRYIQLQRLAIMALICCLPLGLCAWYEFNQAKAAFSRNAQSDGERHVSNLKRYAITSIVFGTIIFIIIIINPFRILGHVQDGDAREDGP